MAKTYTELAPPDVSVVVETTTVSPTIVTPTLPACIVAPCYQIVEVTDSGAPNSEAILTLPAIVAAKDATGGTGSEYASVGGTTLIFSVNGSADVTVTFSASPADKTPTQVVSEINAALVTAGLSGSAVAEVIAGVTTGKYRFHIRTTETGSSKSISIKDCTSLTIFGFSIWRTMGVSEYDQEREAVPTYNFPAPRNNMDELIFDPDNVTVAIDEGTSSLRVLSSDSAIERAGQKGLELVEDGDYDGWTPKIKITNTATDERNLAAAPTGWLNDNSVFKLSQATDGAGVDGSVAINPTGIADKTLIMSVSGSPYQIITFTSGDDSGQKVVDRINTVFPGLAALGTDVPGELDLDVAGLTIRLATMGRESCIAIHPDSTALTNIDSGSHIKATVYYGTWFPVQVNDEFYLNGVLKGSVTRIIEAAATYTIFEISNELQASDIAADDHWYFKSKNLPGGLLPADSTPDAPTPEVYVTTDGDVHIKQLLLRDDNGAPLIRTVGSDELLYGTATIYLGYKALRLDVSPAADSPRLLSFDSTDDIDDEIGPITVDNPLAMGSYLCKLACPERTVYATGLEEVSDAYPYGTSAAHTSAAEFLANAEVYTIVPSTQDTTIQQMWSTHVTTYSGVDYKMERCVFVTAEIPTRAPNDTLASGTNGATIDTTHFNTNIVGLTSILRENELDPLAPTDVYIVTETNPSYYYLVTAVSGSIVTIDPAPTDTFYHTGNLDTGLINEQVAVMLRGAELVDGSGNPDKDAIAEALADTGQIFDTSRVIVGAPDYADFLDGSLQVTDISFYAACVEAGKKSQVLPHFGFTNTTTPGIISVNKASNYFSRKQMNIAAGGGIWWWWNETPTSAVTVRHQLTTDTTTVESREWSLLTALDYLAKTVRLAVRPLLGKYNINEDLLRLLDAILHGIRNELVDEKKIYAELEFGSIEQVTGQPDALEVVVDLIRIYPFNKMTFRIRV